MKRMILITTDFPYGAGESFLETEVSYYTKFDRVHIFPIGHHAGKMRAVPSNVTVYKKKKEAKVHSNVYHWDIIRELWYCVQRRGWNETFLKTHLYRRAIDYYSRAYHEADRINKLLKEQGVQKSDHIVIYSYWMHMPAIVAVLLSHKYPHAKCVTRCHGGDLYEERDKDLYLPFRKLIFDGMDVIIPISNNGKQYLRERYGKIRAEIRMCRLGVNIDVDDLTPAIWWGENGILRLVSSSSLIPVKRIERIVGALSQIYDIPIVWKHFGDGECEKKLKELCEKLLSGHDNIRWQFMGRVTNREMLDYYAKEKPHVLINVSESEGLPVSMMEAMGCGIPVIGTNVGGVGEIIIDKRNGYLLNANADSGTIAAAISKFYRQSGEEYKAMSRYARKMYDKRYNANVNYGRFVDMLLE